MKKKIRLIIGLCVFIGLIFGISALFQKDDENGNLANMGLACEKDGVIYYNKYEKGIFASKNGEEKQLTEETAYSLNLVEDKIYYITVADSNHVVIKSVDINGENLKTLATIYTSISKIYVDKQFIYYTTNETGKGIAKINLNGENEQILVTQTVQDFQVSKNNIYFVNEANQICKVNIAGQNQVSLNDTAVAKKIQVVGQWIYYYNSSENALFRLKLDGKKNELVSVLIHNEIYNVSGKYVYYLDRENSKIARMKIGKSNQCDDIVQLGVTKTKINIVKDELYYLDKSTDETQTYQINRVKVNGDKLESIQY